MNCPYCNCDRTKKNGKTVSGEQAYRCKECDRRFSGNPPGRKLLGDRKLTSAEKSKRYRDKKRKEKESE